MKNPINSLRRWWSEQHGIFHLIIFLIFYFGLTGACYLLITGLIIWGGSGVAQP